MLPHSSSAVAAWAVAPAAEGEEKSLPAAASSLDLGCLSLGRGWWHDNAEEPEEIPTRVETIPPPPLPPPPGSTTEVEGLGLAVSVKKVIKGLKKASKLHAKQAKTLKGVIGEKKKRS